MSNERKPLLGYKEAASWLDPEDLDGGSALHWIGKARDFYEAKITIGELRVSDDVIRSLEEEYERLESLCNEDDARGRGSYWVCYYRDFQRFLLNHIQKQ